ncbi:MAG: transposase, partial [Lachnospiraceae bacterium]|nr:transposase [Lachnospiraceae bacterium]
TCFISLVLFRLLEKEFHNKYTVDEIITTLRNMRLHKVKGEGYLPSYTRNDLTDSLHEKHGFRTDYQIITNKEIKKIFKKTKT